MFGFATEKRVLREASRMVSLKEDKSVVSWERVREIGELLQSDAGRDRFGKLGRELQKMAHANLSMLSKLGIESEPSAHVMPSGIEMIDGGLAEAAFEEQEAEKEHETQTQGEFGREACSDAPVPIRVEHAMGKTCSIEALRFEEGWDELLGLDDNQKSDEDVVADASVDDTIETPIVDVKDRPISNEVEEAADDVAEEPPTQAAKRRMRFARFHSLYESRDHGLCVFEDDCGHLVAVDSSKLA